MGRGKGFVCLISRRWDAGCEIVFSSPSNHILPGPGTRSSWTKSITVWIQIIFLFMPKIIHKSLCFLSRKFTEAWSSCTKSHLWCAMQFVIEISTSMKTPCKNSTIPNLVSLMIPKFSFPCIMVSMWKQSSGKATVEWDFTINLLLASAFDNTKRYLRFSSENPRMMVSVKKISFQRY